MSKDEEVRKRVMRERAAWATKAFGAPFFESWSPNWDTYGHIPEMPLWHAAALSCDIDPECFVNIFDGVALDDPLMANLPEEFKRRMKIAMANVGKALPAVSAGLARDQVQPEAWMIVRLTEFATWAQSIGWTLPDGFPRGEPDGQQLETRERSSYNMIIAALAKEAEIDITRTSKAAGLIEGLTDALGKRVSLRTIDEHLKRVVQELPKGIVDLLPKDRDS